MLRRTSPLAQAFKSLGQGKGGKYDLAVIGGGPGGFAAAIRARDFGKSVVLIENNVIGGCGVYGALTSKSLWERAIKCPSIGLERAMQEMQATAELRTLQMEHQLKCSDVQVVHGFASFKDEHTLQVDTSKRRGRGAAGGAEDQIEISADNVIIATGSTPRHHPLADTDGSVVMNSDHILERWGDFPRSMVIVGAGVIGCEFATILNAFRGQTQVRLIEKADRILPREDSDVSRYCQRNLERGECKFHLKSELIGIYPNYGEKVVDYILECKETGDRSSHQADAALICIGRTPVLPPGLDDYSQATPSGQLDKHPHIYAVGDVTEDVALVSVAEMEGRAAVEEMYCVKGPKTYFSLENISSIMFLDPCVASVGLNESQARAQGIPYRAARVGYDMVARGIAAPGTHGTDGFVKLLISNDEEMRLLGVRALGPEASSITDVCSLLIRGRKTLKDFNLLMSSYPSIVEGLQEASRMLQGTSIFKPEAFNRSLQLSEWDGEK